MSVTIGSGNGFVPNRQQAITWTIDDHVHMASLVHDQLFSQQFNKKDYNMNYFQISAHQSPQ